MIKNMPGSRKLRTFDCRSKDVMLFNRVNSQYILAKLKGRDANYWSLMNVDGKLAEIPPDLKKILNSQEWN